MKPAISLLVFGFLLLGTTTARADDMAVETRKAVDKGLAWIARNQAADGHWEANGGHYPVSMTALGGMVLLMEGSTIRDGKYAERIRKAADWLMDRCQRNGMIGNPNIAAEGGRYMYGHGFGMLFLSQVYGEEEDGDRRKKLATILTKAVEFTGKAQTNRGGWGYVSAVDGNNFDEGSVTITQMQALRAARNSGIVVPKSIIDKATDYLKQCTTERGGVIYSLGQGGGRAMAGGERVPLTAAAIACAFNAGEYNSPLAKKWLSFCQSNISIDGSGGRRTGHDEYTHYYLAQALYVLGDKGYERMFPESRAENRLTWSTYRKSTFQRLIKSQSEDGSWSGGGGIGTMYATALYLTILQLDNGTLPIYQR